MSDGITVIQQTTAERRQETIDLFNKIKPLLDDGWIYSAAIQKVMNLPPGSKRYQRTWYRDLVDYGESQGYKYGDCSGKKNNKNGRMLND